MKILFFLLLSVQVFSQSTTTITSSHTTNEVVGFILPTNMDVESVESKSSRIISTVVVTADIPLNLLEFVSKDIKTLVKRDSNGVYSISVETLPTKIYKGKEIKFTYKVKLVLPESGKLVF